MLRKIIEDWDSKSSANSFSLDVETMYSARAGCGFHCTSATSHVPPWGRKRGTSDGAFRSMIKRPLRLHVDGRLEHQGRRNERAHAARTKSRYEGLMLIYFRVRERMDDTYSTYVANRVTHKTLHINDQALLNTIFMRR
jgi:hypothetical protein